MISDKGNVLNTVKLVVYMESEKTGFVHVAAEQGSLPDNFTKSRKFKSTAELGRIVSDTYKAIRSYENRQHSQISMFDFACSGCNTVISTDRVKFDYEDGKLVAKCGLCDSTRLTDMRNYFRK